MEWTLKLPVSTLERLSHPVSQTGPFVVVGPTVPAQQKNSFLAITFKQSIIGEIHESKTFEMSFDICWYLAFASQIDDVDVRARTDIQTHKTTAVTLAAHARRGLHVITFNLNHCLSISSKSLSVSLSSSSSSSLAFFPSRAPAMPAFTNLLTMI